MFGSWLFSNTCISLFGKLVVCLRLKKPASRLSVPAGDPVKCFPSPGCGIWAVRSGANRRSGSWVGKPITCWGLGRARRRADPAQGQGQGQRAAGGAQRPPAFLRDGPAGGRADAGTQARRDGGGPTLECSFLGRERLCTGVENSLGWGFARSPPPPTPGPPSRRFLGAFRTAL